MKIDHFDAIIIGAGINGVGIAKRLSNRDKKILVIDKSSIASGTSSKSSRLIHGGLRYLENFEFSLVKESLRDRNLLVKNYPNLVKMRRFYLPIYKNSKRGSFIIRCGLKLYDYLSGDRDYFSSVADKEKFLKKNKLLNAKNIKKIFYYYDALTDDKELTLTIAKEAKDKQAMFIENYNIKNINFSDDNVVIDDKYSTNLLINASGPWVNEVAKKYNFPINYSINKVSGIHIEVKDRLSLDPLILEAEKNRIFFIIPNENSTIVGTTERKESVDCDDVKIETEDVNYLIENIEKYFNIKVKEESIINSWIGIRPLIESKNNMSKISRDYVLDMNKIGKNNILNIFGGKLTTFNSLSREVEKLIDGKE